MKSFKTYLAVLTSSLLVFISSVSAQNVGINSKGSKPNSDAVLDLRTGNLGSALGFLPNEVALSATNNASPFSVPDTGLIVYNYATAGTSPNNVTPGYYYWTGAAWAMILAPGAGTAGQVLISNGGGTPSWTILSTSGTAWQLTGNSGTTVGTNFIGTKDSQPLEFKVNDTIAGYINYSSSLANTSFGYKSLNDNASGIYNTAFGYQSLYSNTTGKGNSTNGYEALYNNTTGLYNVANGYQALYSNTGSTFNIAEGYKALYNHNNRTGNIGIGYEAMINDTTGVENTGIGYNAGVTSGNLTNATAIGANASVSASNSLVLGNGANVGIGTSSPAQKLQVVGTTETTNFEMTNGAATGYVLQSDASGNGTWVNPTSLSTSTAAWQLTGNSGTTVGTNFIGTKDSQPLEFKVGDSLSGYIDYNGSLANSSFGYQALNSNNNNGILNSAFGYQALYSNTSGFFNNANGYQALYYNTSGNSNVADGGGALAANTIGSLNTAVGRSSLENNSNGSSNSSVGEFTLFSNTSGSKNTAIGSEALQSNITGSNNTAIGYLAMGNNKTGSYNVANGYQALGNNKTGSYNVANGYQALGSNTAIGSYNIADGYEALQNTSGSYNIATGYQALQNGSGSYNIVSGDSAIGNGSNTGALNIAVGSQAMYNNTSGSSNVVAGYQALYNNNSGSGNLAIGYQAGRNNTTGNYNTAIGYNSGVSSGALTNATAIGYNSTVSANNQVVLGNTGVTSFVFNGDLEPGLGNFGTSGQVLTSQGTGTAPQWVTPVGTTYIAGTGIKISNDTISNTKSTSAINYVGTSYLGLNSGYGATGNNEGNGYSNLNNINVGDSSGYYNLNSTNNIAIGRGALLSNNQVNKMIAIGTDALGDLQNNVMGDGDIAIGYQADMYNNYSGGNVAIGYQSQLEFFGNGLSNTSVGYQTLYNCNSNSNSIFGSQALDSGTGGSGFDCAFGYEALQNDVGGDNNAFGFQALLNNSNGQFNVANGNQALYHNTKGNNNVAMGSPALYRNTTGNNNAAYGYHAMYNSTTGSYNIASGDSALGGAANTGNLNIAIGSQSGYNNTSGNENIALGDHSLYANNSGSNNIVIGNRALSINNSPSDEIVIGATALQNVSSGSSAGDVVIGYGAMNDASISSNNVVIGYQAEGGGSIVDPTNSTSVGYRALYNNSTQYNSALGYQAGQTVSAGKENTLIGASADVSSGSLTNATAIGYSATVSTSNTVLLGNNSVISTEFNGALMPYYSSAYNAGTSGQVLESQGAGVAPQWTTPITGTVTGSGTATQIAFWNGTSALSSNSNLYWDNTNDRLGIGTSSPTAALHTIASGAKTAAYSGNLLTNTATSSTASIKKAGVEIQSTGSWTGTTASNIGLYVSSVTGGTNNYDAIFNGGGNVGIGTASPGANLDVIGTGNNVLNAEGSSTTGTWVNLNNTTTGGKDWDVISTGSGNSEGAGNLLFKTTSTGDIMIIQSSTGNVGIGTATPGNLLTVNGTTETTNFEMTNGATNGYILQSNASGNGTWVSPNSGLGAVRYVGTSYLGITSGAGSTGTSEGTSSNLNNINIGANAGNANTTASDNIALGYKALTSNTSGTPNTAVGYLALEDNVLGASNVAIGDNTLVSNTASWNTAIGSGALNSNTSGSNNTAVGYTACLTSSGSNNTGIGSGVTTSGSNGTAIGYGATANGNNATAIGANATASANNCLVLGSGANVGIGTSSPTAILHTVASGAKTAAYSGNLLTNTATSSTASIIKAGLEIQSTGTWNGSSASNIGLYVSSVIGSTNNYDAIFNGGGNVGIGTSTPINLFTVSAAPSGGTYLALIDNTANIAASEGLLIRAGQTTYSGTNGMIAFQRPDGTALGSITQNSSTSVLYNTTSDERLKENIKPTSIGLNDLMKIQVKDYTYKSDNGQNQQTGYLAQQLYTVFPNAVHVGGADAKTDPWMVDYGRITPLLVKSIQDQQQIIDEQNKKLVVQQQQMDSQQQQMTAQQKQIDELKQMMEQLQKDKK